MSGLSVILCYGLQDFIAKPAADKLLYTLQQFLQLDEGFSQTPRIYFN